MYFFDLYKRNIQYYLNPFLWISPIFSRQSSIRISNCAATTWGTHTYTHHDSFPSHALFNTFPYVFYAATYAACSFLNIFLLISVCFICFCRREFAASFANPPRPGGQVLGFILSVYKTAVADPERRSEARCSLAIFSCALLPKGHAYYHKS